MSAPTRFSYSRRALRWARAGRVALAAVELSAAGEGLVVHGGNGGDAQCVALAAPYGHPWSSAACAAGSRSAARR
ncbi:hypothetical protein ACF06W_22380 [Streptomyces albus]|uniref:hypothetical protein n=1 Tax=Streptomyces albus TaxID=1888 RepID=UPI0037016B84